MKSLAVKYRPKTFDDVVSQNSIKCILTNQLQTNSTKGAYLFCGGAGTGKTTCARIFANEINKGSGTPIEIDAASNNSVENIREISQQAKTQSIDSEYKVFIMDECHVLSNSAWQAMLKLIEEPPAKCVFILATTDPQKIPNTILSRVQRFDFSRIPTDMIINRLSYICTQENIKADYKALEFIAKKADGGMRDAITMLDECTSYAEEITIDNVIKALGLPEYHTMFSLLSLIIDKEVDGVLNLVEDTYMNGRDLKQFVSSIIEYILDIVKEVNCPGTTKIPNDYDYSKFKASLPKLLDLFIKLNADIKWETNPKLYIQAYLYNEVNKW